MLYFYCISINDFYIIKQLTLSYKISKFLQKFCLVFCYCLLPDESILIGTGFNFCTINKNGLSGNFPHAKNGLDACVIEACKPFYPPQLIIQDELHLISGPLGTIYGGYETIIEDMCCLEKNGKKAPLTWEDKDGELTLKESEGGTGGYFITYDLGVFRTHIEQTQKEDAVNTVILYVPEKAQLLDAEIQLSDGDLTADQLLCEKMTAKLSDGDLMLDKGVFEKFEAKLGDGDMDVKELQCTDNMQLKSENGDVSIKKADLADGQIALDDGELQMGNSSFNGDMEITNSNGDVSIQMKNGNVDKTNIYLKTTDGDVDTRDLSRGKSSNEEDLSVYENKVGASAPTLNVNSSDGDITLTESAR